MATDRGVYVAVLISFSTFIIPAKGADLVEPVPIFEESFGARKSIIPERISLDTNDPATPTPAPSAHNGLNPVTTEKLPSNLKNDSASKVIPNGNSSITCHSNSTIIKSVDESNCSRYFVSCMRNSEKNPNSNHSKSRELKLCPDGKYFDSIDLECVNKQAAECKPYICKETGFFPDPKSSTKFIHCLKDGPKRLHCEPEGTTFSSEAKACLWNTEEHSVILRFFKGLLWIIKVTEGNSGSLHGAHNDANATTTIPASTGYTKLDIFKLVFVAIMIPVLYGTTVFAIYVQINMKRRKADNARDRYISDAEEFHRFYTRPSPGMRSLSHVGSRIDISNLYQTPCININPHNQRNSRAMGDESNYSTTRM